MTSELQKNINEIAARIDQVIAQAEADRQDSELLADLRRARDTVAKFATVRAAESVQRRGFGAMRLLESEEAEAEAERLEKVRLFRRGIF